MRKARAKSGSLSHEKGGLLTGSRWGQRIRVGRAITNLRERLIEIKFGVRIKLKVNVQTSRMHKDRKEKARTLL